MCSITVQQFGSTGSELAAVMAHAGELNEQVAAMLADPSRAGDVAVIPDSAMAGFVPTLAASVRRGRRR
jgi:hypothetical protein